MERLSRYCHRGLSSGGSRRFSRRDRHGGNRLPAGKGWCWVRAWGSRAPGGEPQPQPASRVHGLCSCVRPPAGPLPRVPKARPYSPRKRPLAKAAPSATEPRASAAGTESRGTGWVMVRAGGSGVQVTCARVTGTALGPAGPRGSNLPGQCPRNRGLDRHLAASWPYCKPRPRGSVVI